MAKPKTPKEPPMTDEHRLYLAITYSLYRTFQPFPGQMDIGHAIFTHKARMIFVRCGRGWGKTYCLAWLAAKKALETPNSLIYLTAPLYKQAKRIYWLSGLLDEFIHEDFIEQRSNQETYLVLKNGSQLYVDGSDNYDAHRGLKPNFVIADEYADFDPKWVNVMMPNVAKTRGQMIFIGTPPEMPRLSNGEDHHYVQLRKQIQRMSNDHPGKAFFIHKPTSDNPYSDKEFLEDELVRLTELGQEFVYQREYLAQEVSGSSLQIFPMFDRRQDELKIPHDELMAMIQATPDKFEYGCFVDPGTKSVFAVRFMALDRYNSTPYWLDEIYETNPEDTVPSVMCPRIQAKMEELAPGQSWDMVADSAASSFILDASENHDMIFSPCVKQAGDKTEFLGILARVFLQRSRIISDRCVKTCDEYIGYVRGPDGRPVKHRDHLIDCLIGDTLVDTVDGQVPIRDLVGKTGLVYSRDGKICRFYDVRRTHSNTPVSTVTFSTGQAVTATPNHQFLLASGEWKRVDELRSDDKMQTATEASYGKPNYRYKNLSRIFRDTLLQVRELFPTYLRGGIFPSASQGLGAQYGGYPRGFSYPPLGCQYSQQPYREPLLLTSGRAYASPFDASRAQGGCKPESLSSQRRVPRAIKSLEKDSRGQEVASRQWPKDNGKKARNLTKDYYGLLSLWQGLRNAIPKTGEILSRQLQGQGFEKETTVSEIAPAGVADTYCMAVEETNCFSVEGGIIVHNCDRYGLKYMGYGFTDAEEKKKVVRPMEEGRMRTIDQDLRDMRKSDLVSQILGSYE